MTAKALYADALMVLGVLILCLFFGGFAFSQSSKPPPPPSLPIKAPSNSAWQITLTVGNLVQPVRYDSQEGRHRIRISPVGGKITEIWIFGKNQSILYVEGGALVWSEVDILASYFPLADGVIPGVEWLHSSNYKGVVTYEGRECHYYSAKLVPPGMSPDPSIQGEPEKVEHHAWLDLETGRPIASKQGGTSQVYEFGLGSPNLSLPASIQTAIDARVSAQKARAARHAMP